MKKFLLNTVTKSIILTILPLIYGIVFPYALGTEMEVVAKERLYWISAIVFVIHIVALVIYGIKEQKQKNQLEENHKAPKELRQAKELCATANKIAMDNANILYESVRMRKNHSDIADWRLMEARGDDLCKVVLNMVKALAEVGGDFSVSMMFKKVENGENGYTMLSRATDDLAHVPRSYRSFVLEADAEGFYYKKVMDQNPNRPQILKDKKEIKKHFKDSDAMNYSQYIVLPISCKSNKIIGILQIVAYNGSILAKKKKELERLCNDYFSLCATLMLLTDKVENIQQVVGE